MRSWSSWISFSKTGVSPGQILPNPQKMHELRGEVAELIVPPQKIDGSVTSHPHEPGGRIVGEAVNRPHFIWLTRRG